MKSFNSILPRLLRWPALVLFAIASLSSSAAQAQQTGVPDLVLHYADIVLYNGKILTVDRKFTTVQAVALRDGKFLAVGTTAEILPLAGPKTRKIDLQGKMAVPGFVDTHQHPFSEGFQAYLKSKYPIRGDWKDVDAAYEDVAKLVKQAKPGEPILLASSFQVLCGKAVGTLDKLDALSPENPVVFIEGVNVWPDAINSKTAALVKRFVDGPIFRKEGSPCLSIEAREAVSGYFVSHQPWEAFLEIGHRATQGVSRMGITTVKEHTAPPLMTSVRELWKRGELTVRMRMPYPFYPLTGNASDVPPKLAEKLYMYSGNLSGVGDDMWRFTGIRPQAVGGNMRTASAWTMEPKQRELAGMKERPYGLPSGQWDVDIGSNVPGEGETFAGRESLVQAIRYGWDVATDHTIGDRAVEEVLKAMEQGLKTRVIQRPGQILAMGHTPMSTPEQIRKMKELGVRPGIGPMHLFGLRYHEPGLMAYGSERLMQMEPYRMFLDAGVRASLEGDNVMPIFWKIERAVTRKDEKYGRVWNAAYTVTREEALRMSTNNGAYQLGEEDKLGSIETGKLADIIVLDQDYLTVPDDQISKINVLMTIMGGKVVYEMEGGLK